MSTDHEAMAKRKRKRSLSQRLLVVDNIMQEIDGGYHNQDLDKYPPFALAAWDDRKRFRDYVERVLLRLQKEGKLHDRPRSDGEAASKSMGNRINIGG